MLTALGNETGELVQVVAVALGIGVVVERSVLIFTLIKLAGAAYLIVLGLRAVRDRRSLARMLDAAAAPPAVPDASSAKGSWSGCPTRRR